MRVLVLFAHPVETSFGAAVHETLVATLKKGGHAVDDCDLNKEGFDPVMTRQDRLDYHEPSVNRERVRPWVDRLLAAEAVAFSFPVWNMGFPAILKGFVDKVFIPGVSFNMTPEGDYVPCLHNVKKLGVACTYGGTRLRTFLAGDPCRRFITRSLAYSCAPGTRCDYVALHDMNHTRADKREAFLRQVEQRFSRW
jgi:putative NADPH-quinone reductase